MAQIRYFTLNQGAAGPTEIAAAEAGKKHRVLGITLSLANDGTWRLTGSGNLTGNIKQDGQLQPVVIGPNLIPFVETAAGVALNIVTTQAAQGVVQFISEP
jgi:hypothetical protein